MQAASIDLTIRTRVKEFGRTHRISKDTRLFLVGSGEGEMLEMLGTFVGEEIDGSHFSAMADAFKVQHVDDLLALFEQVPKYLGSIRLQGVLIDADPKTNIARRAVLVAQEGDRRRVIVREDLDGVFEDTMTPITVADWISASFR
jgi:hypothetical protein